MRLIDAVEQVWHETHFDTIGVMFFTEESGIGFIYWGSGEITHKLSGYSLRMNDDTSLDYSLSEEIKTFRYDTSFLPQPTLIIEMSSD